MRQPLLLSVLVSIASALPATAWAQYPPIYYPGLRYAAAESDLRIAVKPKEASVYVDGYFAGKVEEFDGAFQRLHVSPGEHDIVVFLEGYRSLRQRLYLSPNSTRKIEGSLEKIAPGELPDVAPRPAPIAEREDFEHRSGDRDRMPRGPRRMPPPRDLPQRPEQGPASRFGTLSIRVQPGGASVFVDGERWTGPSNSDERLIIQVPDGRHRVEVERDGYERFVTEIDVQRSETAAMNISLIRSR